MAGKAGQQTTKATEVSMHYSEQFLDEMDGRYRAAKTLRQRLKELTGDLSGVDNLSYQERSLCKRAIHLARVIEKFESTLAHGGTVEFGHLFGLINALSGLLSKLGLRRRAKTVQSLSEYFKGHGQTTHEDTPE